MNSTVLNYIGLGWIDPGIVFISMIGVMLIMLILLIVQMCKTKALRKKYDLFMDGSNGQSLENEIGRILKENARLRGDNEAINKEIDHLYNRLETVVQKVGVIKYDAFQQMGGKLSYAIAVLDETNTGFLLNSVHSVDGCYTYVKVIKKGKPDVDLSTEEQKALTQAMSR